MRDVTESRSRSESGHPSGQHVSCQPQQLSTAGSIHAGQAGGDDRDAIVVTVYQVLRHQLRAPVVGIGCRPISFGHRSVRLVPQDTRGAAVNEAPDPSVDCGADGELEPDDVDLVVAARPAVTSHCGVVDDVCTFDRASHRRCIGDVAADDGRTHRFDGRRVAGRSREDGHVGA